MSYLNRLLPLIVILILTSCYQKKQAEELKEIVSKSQNTNTFDAEKAKALGADQYGMKKYVMAFLKRGPNRELDSLKAAELQAAHMANIGAMAEAGKLILAGPFFGNDDLRGIYVFDVQSIEEAEALTNSDPAIQAGSLVMELKEWYGSAALMEVNEIHTSIAKENP